jgi:hypothetical protein
MAFHLRRVQRVDFRVTLALLLIEHVLHQRQHAVERDLLKQIDLRACGRYRE